MSQESQKISFELQQLSSLTPFIVVVDKSANVTWVSEAVHWQFEKVVGMKVSQLIAFTEPRQDCSVALLSTRLGRWCKLVLLGTDAEIPLVGKWIADGRELILLATPNPSTSKDLDQLTFDDFPENDHLIDLLVARDESATSLAEASSAAEALKQKSRDAEQAEKIIRVSESHLKAILDTVHSGILLIDAETHQIVDANTCALKMIGSPKTEILEKVCHQFVCPTEKRKCPITDLDQKVDHSECVLLTADGDQIPILKTVTRVTLDGKEYLLDSFVDLSKRKQAEEQLRQKNEFLHNVLESLTHPFYVIDANSYTIKMANRAACDEYQIENSSCYNISHRQDVPCDGKNDPCPLAEVRETRKPTVVEHVHYDKKGRPRDVEVHAYPILDDKGNVSEIIEYWLDITESKRVQREIEEQRRLLETVFAAAPIGMLLVDEDIVVKQVNYVMGKLVGKDISDIADKRAGEGLDCIHSQDNKAGCGHGPACSTCPIRKGIESVFETGRPLRGAEVQAEFVIGGNPVRLWLEVSADIAQLSEKKYVIVALNNITERKQADEELRKTHRRLVEAAHKAGMGEVATNILHNIGNILNSINISVHSIRDTVLNSRAGSLKKVVDILSEHTDELRTFLTEDERGRHIPTYLKEVAALMVGEQADMIEKTRSLTRHIEHVKQIVQSQQKYARVGGVEVLARVSEIIDDAVQINQEGLTRHGVTLHLELAELPEIHIDKQRVLQILVNLISNGKYAVSQSGKQEKVLIIRSYIHGENRMCIEVEDNGIGITKENLPKLFQHGFTTKEEGHGFGLHSSLLAAQKMGGPLTVHSDGLGHGATFTLEIPLIKSEVVTNGYRIS